MPLVIPVISKCVTSAPSTALRLMTRPDVVCVSSLVVALVTDGVSATGVTLKLTVAVLLFGSGEPLVVPLSVMVYWKLAAPLKFAAVLYSTFVAPQLTLPPPALPTSVLLFVLPLTSVPVMSLASSESIVIVRWPESSASLSSVSLLAVGASLTSVILKLTVAVLLFGSAEPLVVPLSVMVYWKLAGPLKSAAGVK